jgi:branched-chain amino acid transport system substrate-binding protein
MMKLSRRAAIGLGLGAAFAFSTTGAYAADPIKIGFPANVTGVQASLDGPMLNGAKLAIAEINASGGVLGSPLELVTYDSKSDATVISTVASQLIDSDKVVGIIGFADSDSVLSIGPQVDKAKIPFITPGATSPKLPSQLGGRRCRIRAEQARRQDRLSAHRHRHGIHDATVRLFRQCL